MADESDLDTLLDSLAANARVDWQRAESTSASPESRAHVHALSELARIAEFHHSLQRDSGMVGHRTNIERWGELLILERTASGSSGELFRAWDGTLQREVALKLLAKSEDDNAETADWLEEARMLARLRDPHVVTIHGAAEHDGRVGLWMEFLAGGTLEQEIAQRGRRPADEVARLGAQLGRALAAVHESGTLHRDVKPANIVLEREGRAVLTDFGLGQRRDSGRRTRPFSGTPLFMSPQRLAGAVAKPTDDLYALGVALWWALAGRPPFRAETLEALRDEVARGPVAALATECPDAPPALRAAIERAMAREPMDRFATAAELSSAFEAVSHDVAPAMRTPADVPAPKRGASWLAMVATALVVGAGVVWFAVSHREPARSPAPTAAGSASGASAPSVAAPSLSYDVTASFFRRGKDGDVRLETGDRVVPGDQVSLEFHATRPTWVYVLDADERGETYLLFPQPVFDLRNPLPAEKTVELPGARAGTENAWTVTSRGGREHLLVVANVEPVPELESEIARIPAPIANAPIHYARLDAGTVTRLRGMGGFGEVRAADPAGRTGTLFERIRALAGQESNVHGTWVRQVVLENPAR